MGFWSTLGNIGLSVGSALIPGGSLVKDGIKAGIGAAGAGLGAASQGSANNRGEKLAGQMDLERLLMDRDAQFQSQSIAREQEGRAGGNDAWRRLIAAQRTLSPGAKPQLSPYSIAPRQATGAEMQGADAMSNEVMARLLGGNPMPQVQQRQMNVDPGLMDPSGFEKFSGLASPILGFLSRYGQKPQQGA